jgi:hypothetical protein
VITEDEEREAGFSFGNSLLSLHQRFLSLVTFGEEKRITSGEAKNTVGIASRDHRWNSQSSILSLCSKQRKTGEMPA